MWEGVKSALSTIAPILGNAFGGPLGGVAMSFLTSALGISNPTPEALETAIANATPEQRIAMVDAQIRLTTAVGNLQIQSQQIEQEDTADARAMAENLSTTINPKGWVILIIMILAAVTGLGMFGMIGYWAYWCDTALDASDMRKLVFVAVCALIGALVKFLWGKFKNQE